MSDQNMPDLDHGIEALTETTTPAELMRKRGQRTKLRTVKKDKLKQWMEQAIAQVRAGMTDEFDDREKEAMLAATKAELDATMARMAKAEAAVRDREAQDLALQEEIEALRTQASTSQAGTGELEQALAKIKTLTDMRDQAQAEADEARADLYQTQDQLNEKLTLLGTTIEEKDKLKHTMQELMMRAGELNNGVLGLDNEYYGGRHQADNQPPEDAEGEALFYHDYDVGAAVINSLAQDLQRLRSISSQGDHAGIAERSASQPHLLAKDLELLEQLQQGDLHAVEVAEPIANLIEAVRGTREAAMSQAGAASDVLGIGIAEQHYDALPDPDGDPAEVLAEITHVVRQLERAFEANKGRLHAMKALADEADGARESTDTELNELLQANRRLIKAIVEQAERHEMAVPDSLMEDDVPANERSAAGEALVKQFGGRTVSTAAVVAPGPAAAPLEKALLAGLVDATRGDMELAQIDAVAELAIAIDAEEAQPTAQTIEQAAEVIAALGARRAELADQLALAEARIESLTDQMGDGQATLIDEAGSAMRVAVPTGAVPIPPTEQVPVVDFEAADAAQSVDQDELYRRIEMLETERDDLLAKLDEQEAKHAEIATTPADGVAVLPADEDVQAELVELKERLAVLEPEAAESQAKIVALTEQRDEAQTDLNEFSDSVREVNKQLTEQVQQRDEKLKGLRERVTALEQVNRSFERAVSVMAEQAQQVMAEEGADGEQASTAVADAHTALQEALSNMPADEDVPVAPEAASALVAATQGLTEAFKADFVHALAANREVSAGSQEVVRILTEKKDALQHEKHALEDRLAASEQARQQAEHASRTLAEQLVTMASEQADAEDVQEAVGDLEASLSADAVPDQTSYLADAQRVLHTLRATAGQKNQARLAELEQQVSEQAERLVESEAEATVLKEELAAAQAAVAAHEEEAAATSAAITQELEQRLEQAEAARHEAESALTTVQESVAEIETAKRATAEELSSAQTALAEKTVHVDELQAQLQALEAQQQSQLESTQAQAAERQESEAMLQTQAAELAAAQQAAALAEQAQARAHDQATQAQADLAAVREQLEEQNSRLSGLAEELAAKQLEHEALLAEKAQWDQQRAELEQSMSEAQAAQAAAEAQQEQFEANRLDTDAALEAVQNSLAHKAAEVASLQEAHAVELAALREQIAQHQAETESTQAQAAEQAESLADIQANAAQLEQSLQEEQEQSTALQAQLDELTAAKATAEESLQQTEQKLAQVRRDQQDLLERQSALEQKQVEEASFRQELEAERDRFKQLLREAKAALEEYKAREESAGGFLGEEVESLRDQLVQAQELAEKQQRSLEEELDNKDISYNALQARLEELRGSLDQRDKHIAELQQVHDEIAQVRTDKNDAEKQLERVSAELAELKDRHNTLAAELEHSDRDVTRLQVLEEELDRSRQDRDETVRTLRTIEDELAISNGKIKGLEEARRKLQESADQDRQGLNQRLREAKQQHEQALEELRRLKSDKAGLEARVRHLTSTDDDA